MRGTGRKRAYTGTAALALAALTGAGLHAAFPPTERALAEETSAAVRPSGRTNLEMGDGFADLAESTTPAVVRIEVQIPSDGVEETMSQGNMPQIPEEFRRFFDFGPNGERGQPQEQGPRFGSGTGFLISADGYVVTNNHVAGDAEKINVTLNDHRSFTAKLVGSDPTTDVAVLKIEGTGLPHLTWGSSNDLRVGEWVMAIGNPGFGRGEQLDYTVTTGIVSGKGRPLQLLAQGLADNPDYGREMAGYAIENFIQTDAVINPGNSGGPLVNMDGRVIGMNSAIASTDGHYQGYGFAIPANLVQKVTSDLIAHGRVERAWLGVSVSAVAPEDAEAFKLPTVQGVVVQSISDGSPAAKAGIEQGDVLVTLDGRAIGSGGDLQELIATHAQGDRVSVGFYREGDHRTAEIRLGEAPRMGGARSKANAPREQASASQKLGLTLTNLDARSAEEFGYQNTGGVIVSDVDPSGPAAMRGIEAGAKVVKIAGKAVSSAAEATGLLGKVGSGQVVSLVLASPSGQERIVNVRAR